MAKWWDVTSRIRLQEDRDFCLAHPTLCSHRSTTSSTVPPHPSLLWWSRGVSGHVLKSSVERPEWQETASEDLRPVDSHVRGRLPDPPWGGGPEMTAASDSPGARSRQLNHTGTPGPHQLGDNTCLLFEATRGLGIMCYTSTDDEYNSVSFLLFNYNLLENIRVSFTYSKFNKDLLIFKGRILYCFKNKISRLWASNALQETSLKANSVQLIKNTSVSRWNRSYSNNEMCQILQSTWKAARKKIPHMFIISLSPYLIQNYNSGTELTWLHETTHKSSWKFI